MSLKSACLVCAIVFILSWTKSGICIGIILLISLWVACKIEIRIKKRKRLAQEQAEIVDLAEEFLKNEKSNI